MSKVTSPVPHMGTTVPGPIMHDRVWGGSDYSADFQVLVLSKTHALIWQGSRSFWNGGRDTAESELSIVSLGEKGTPYGTDASLLSGGRLTQGRIDDVRPKIAKVFGSPVAHLVSPAVCVLAGVEALPAGMYLKPPAPKKEVVPLSAEAQALQAWVSTVLAAHTKHDSPFSVACTHRGFPFKMRGAQAPDDKAWRFRFFFDMEEVETAEMEIRKAIRVAATSMAGALSLPEPEIMVRWDVAFKAEDVTAIEAALTAWDSAYLKIANRSPVKIAHVNTFVRYIP